MINTSFENNENNHKELFEFLHNNHIILGEGIISDSIFPLLKNIKFYLTKLPDFIKKIRNLFINKNYTPDKLIDIYNSLPDEQTELKKLILYYIIIIFN